MAVATSVPPAPPPLKLLWDPTYNMSRSTIVNPDGNKTGIDGAVALAIDAKYGEESLPCTEDRPPSIIPTVTHAQLAECHAWSGDGSWHLGGWSLYALRARAGPRGG
jgi:hypothetical protein